MSMYSIFSRTSINDDREPQREITDWDTGNINDDRDIVTQLQRGRRGYREDI